jgi:hypothetical protein
MFPTVPSERKYMGLIHPATGAHYVYATCPMGTRNSPGATGRFGNAFIRMTLEGCPRFHGMARRNDFLCRLAGEPVEPTVPRSPLMTQPPAESGSMWTTLCCTGVTPRTWESLWTTPRTSPHLKGHFSGLCRLLYFYLKILRFLVQNQTKK